jgi:hypothetical protein
MGESTVFQNIAGFEGVVNNKWTRVHIADWVDKTHDSASAAQVQAGK